MLMKKSIIRGFTLIEVMVVVVILAILAAIIVPNILKRPEQAKMTAAQQGILGIQNAMALYKLDNGFYPSTSQGIQALVTKPSSSPTPQNWASGGYLKKLPVDPWGNKYHYLHPGQHGSIDIWSNGPPGSTKKIGNWNATQ
ncbi:MAG TPA: type II secretion system major pseudopilin GspG [Coxiellaceae bacterium]|nr:MAG: type II secretion system protein GspG [Gammaproteobacteria bacterium RIFCSPHIGHO2_12_FULL_36_30]HLB56082.1 type II secretion system major pseudopilin GspG [Coxiellaceae bacterium]